MLRARDIRERKERDLKTLLRREEVEEWRDRGSRKIWRAIMLPDRFRGYGKPGEQRGSFGRSFRFLDHVSAGESPSRSLYAREEKRAGEL